MVIVAGCHAYAYLSWHLIERPALQLKDWTPKWLSKVLARTSRPRRAALDWLDPNHAAVKAREPLPARDIGNSRSPGSCPGRSDAGVVCPPRLRRPGRERHRRRRHRPRCGSSQPAVGGALPRHIHLWSLRSSRSSRLTSGGDAVPIGPSRGEAGRLRSDHHRFGQP